MQVDTWWYTLLEQQAGETPLQYPELPWREMLRQIKKKIGRKANASPERRQKHYDGRAVADVFALALKHHLAEQKMHGCAAVAVLAPPPGEPTLSPEDGYMRRVCAVDQNILFDQERVYFYDSPYWDVDAVRVRQMDTALYAVYYNSRFASHRAFLCEMIALCRLCYIQSVWRLLPPDLRFGEIPQIFGAEDVEYVLDLHGTVPEELLLEGRTEEAKAAQRAESLCLQKCKTVVGVNASSLSYVRSQEPGFKGQFAVCPFFSNFNLEIQEKKKTHPPIVIYAGGGQPWQLLDEMKSAIAACPRKDLLYELYIHGVEDAERERLIPNGVQCKKGVLPQEKLAERYRAAQYGFMLRDDTPINRYATPTKLLDYIQYGIVPILKYEELGDFKTLGMQYITLAQYCHGELPDAEKRDEMARHNYSVVRQLVQTSQQGVQLLRQLVRCNEMKREQS